MQSELAEGVRAATHLKADVLAVQTERQLREARERNKEWYGVFESREPSPTERMKRNLFDV